MSNRNDSMMPPESKNEKPKLYYVPYVVATLIGLIIFIAGLLMITYSVQSGGGYTYFEGADGELAFLPRPTVTEYPLAGLGIMSIPIGLGLASTSIILYAMKSRQNHA